MLFIRACREFVEEMRAIDQVGLAEKYETMADQRTTELKADGEWTNRFGLHAAADAVNAGFTSPSEQARLFAREFSNRGTRISFSPFNQYFVIQAMTMGRYDETLSSVRDDWGGQLADGGTTFFETFWPAWTLGLGPNDAVPNCQAGFTSLCHPWSSGVTKWLTEDTLGIKPGGPGFTRYDVFPHLGRTLTSVSGSVPTPQGTLRPPSMSPEAWPVSSRRPTPWPDWHSEGREDHRDRCVQRQAGVGWHFPRGPWDGRGEDGPGFFDLRPRPARDVPDGGHLHGNHAGVSGRAVAVFDDVRDGRSDHHRQLGGRYGRDGRVLFGAGQIGKNLVGLPDYVAEVNIRQGRLTQWPGTDDLRAPAANSPNAPERRHGVLYTGSPSDC